MVCFLAMLDAHVWKMFNVYADAGYKKQNTDPKFIWDSGIN